MFKHFKLVLFLFLNFTYHHHLLVALDGNELGIELYGKSMNYDQIELMKGFEINYGFQC